MTYAEEAGSSRRTIGAKTRTSAASVVVMGSTGAFHPRRRRCGPVCCEGKVGEISELTEALERCYENLMGMEGGPQVYDAARKWAEVEVTPPAWVCDDYPHLSWNYGTGGDIGRSEDGTCCICEKKDSECHWVRLVPVPDGERLER